MKKNRTLRTVLFAIVMTLAMSVTAFAGTVDKTGAKETALKDAGLTASKVKRMEVEYDDESNSYEIEFVQKSNKTEFEYEISARDGKIIDKSVEYAYKRNTSKKKISKNDAIKRVAKASGVKASVIKKGSCKYTYKKKTGKYTIKFRSGNYRYEYELLAPTGKVIEYEYELVKR